jgi:HK97 family phage major capsid protein
MDTAKLKEFRGQAEERRKQLHEIFEQAGPELDTSKVKCIEGDDAAKAAKIKALNDELSEIGEKLQPLEDEYAELERGKRHAEEFAEKNGHPLPEKDGDGGGEQKSLGEQFIESKVGGELKGREISMEDFETKALFETGAGWEPESLRTGVVIDKATRPIQVIDTVPAGSTTMPVVKFMEETTFTNAAAEKKEGEAFPEAALKLAVAESPVRKIPVFLPVTDEQLEDVAQAQGYINRRLPFMVRQRLDEQILVGNGANPNLKGFLEATGVQTQAKGADPSPDAIYKGMVKVRVTGRAVPSVVYIHPNDWQQIRLLRTEQGIYIWGNPSEIGPERIWGLPIVQTDAITENTALVGDIANYTELVTRRGIELLVSNSHEDFFVKGKQAVRCSIRVALVVYRGTALCKVTEI